MKQHTCNTFIILSRAIAALSLVLLQIQIVPSACALTSGVNLNLNLNLNQQNAKRRGRVEEHNINDAGESTEFPCDVADGKFRVTTGASTVLKYAYEMVYSKGEGYNKNSNNNNNNNNIKEPTYLASRVTHFVSRGVITSSFDGCKDPDDGTGGRRRMQIQQTPTESGAVSGSASESASGSASGSDRALMNGEEIIVGFENKPGVAPIEGVECQYPHSDSYNHACMVFGGGVTVYFADNERRRRLGLGGREGGGEMDFSSEVSAQGTTIDTIYEIVKRTIEEGSIAQKVNGIQRLTFLPTYPTTTDDDDEDEDEPKNPPSSTTTTTNPPSSTTMDTPVETTMEEETNQLVATAKETPSAGDKDKGGALTIALVVVALACSIVAGMYIRRRRQIRVDRKGKEQQAEEDMEANDVLLDSYVPTTEIIKPLSTDQGVVEVVLDPEQSNNYSWGYR